MLPRTVLLILLLTILILPSHSAAQEPLLQQSVKKQLFLFPLTYKHVSREFKSEQKRYFEAELMRELVYNFPRFAFYEMPADADLDDFLDNANDYLLEHAQEIKQKRVDTGGRYGEEPITLDDLKQIVENGYAFVPRITHAKFEKNSWDIDAELDIYRTYDRHFVGTLTGSTDSMGGLMSLSVADVIESIDDNHDRKPGQKPKPSDIADQFRRRSDGVVQELRTNVRRHDEFAIKAIVTKPGINEFTFNQGEDLGVELDKRYKVWSTSDPTEEGSVLLAFGKVREIRDSESDVQVLIGGWDLTYADQVVEDARFGINIKPVFGFLPISRSGFEPFNEHRVDIREMHNESELQFPDDGRASEFWFGAGLETDLAQWTGFSEFYVVGEAGLVGGLPHTFTSHFNIGFAKKYWFRRVALTLSGRYGLLLVNFSDVEKIEVDGDDLSVGSVHGLMALADLEVLLNPDWAIQAGVGYSMMPEQKVFSSKRDDGYEARIGMTGLTFRFGVLFSL